VLDDLLILAVGFTDDERAGLFERKNFRQTEKEICIKKHSLLSDQLEKCPNLPQNPFAEYAKYDGNVRKICVINFTGWLRNHDVL
jgi:hypothetical protein